jgi:hypothetical protein
MHAYFLYVLRIQRYLPAMCATLDARRFCFRRILLRWEWIA